MEVNRQKIIVEKNTYLPCLSCLEIEKEFRNFLLTKRPPGGVILINKLSTICNKCNNDISVEIQDV